MFLAALRPSHRHRRRPTTSLAIRTADVSRRRFVRVAIAVTLASCGANRGADPASRFFAVHNVMRAIGLNQAGPVNQGSLSAGQEVRVPLTLPATCVAIVALGGSG